MEDVTTNKRKMKELEDNLLYRLTSTQVSLLHTFVLIRIGPIGHINIYQIAITTLTLLIWIPQNVLSTLLQQQQQ